MLTNNGIWIICNYIGLLILVQYGRCHNETDGNAAGDNSQCVSLGVDADSLLEKINPKRLLFFDSVQRGYLQQACEKYTRMRARAGCVPQQPNSIYDYACDTILPLASSTVHGQCWNRTASCALLNLLPSTDSITAAYCKFLTATGVQLGCALDLAPPCDSPTNSGISQAAVKGRSFLESFQCSALVPALSSAVTGAPSIIGNDAVSPGVTGTPSFMGNTSLAPIGPAGLAGTSPSLPLPPVFPNHKSTEPPLPLKSRVPDCDFGQNTKALICASNLIGVQDQFSDTSGSLILQELARNDSTDLIGICQKFRVYHDCMFQQVFQNDSDACLTKSRIHDFALLFYSFCDPANQPRVQRSRPCVQKLVQNPDQHQLAAFNQCREHLINMRANVKIVIKANHNALAMCQGLVEAGMFFDCVKPLASGVCSPESLEDMAYFRKLIKDRIDLVGCPLDDPRLTTMAAMETTQTPSITQSPKVDTVSTGPVDQTVPMLRVDSIGTQCNGNDIRLFSQCYVNMTNVQLDPTTIIGAVDGIDAICQSYWYYLDCHSSLNCTPPAGDALYNMFGFLCDADAEDYKKHSVCMQQSANSSMVVSCRNRVMPRNLLNMNNEEICDWVNDVVNCSYGQLYSNCGLDTADYVFKMWQSYAKGVNTSCVVDMPALPSNGSDLGVPVSCNSIERDMVTQCLAPFEGIAQQLENLIQGGVQAFLRGMGRITAIFKSGCDARLGFDDCMRKSIVTGSQCHVSSCLIKVTEYACNFTGDSDMTLEDRLKCMWSMIGEPNFGKCLKMLPKNSFQSINRLKIYLPRFVNCLEPLLMRKCGPTTVNLVKALASQASTNANDTTCMVNVSGLNELNETIQTIPGSPGSAILPVAAAPTGQNTTTLPPPTINTKPLCRTVEQEVQVEKCHMALGNRSMEPVLLEIFHSIHDLDTACHMYKNYSSCLQSLPCHYEFSSAIEQLLLRVCTVRYNDYKTNSDCLISLANSPIGTQCTTPVLNLNLTRPQLDNGERACREINRMIACISPSLIDRCTTRAADVVYDLHVAFVQQFKSDCVVKPPVLLVEGTECTRQEMNTFETCTQIPNNYTINPVSIIADPDHWTEFCTAIQSNFQPCIKNLTCFPKPYGTALNDSFHFVCTSDEFGSKYEKYKTCLSAVLNTANGRECVGGGYTDITWFGAGDTNRTGTNICKTITSMLTCIAPEISQRCHSEAVKLVYDFNQKLLTDIQPYCQLKLPTDLPTKLNLTTTTETPVNKTTPAKEKEPTTTASGSGMWSANGTFLTGYILLYCLFTIFI